MLDRLAPPAYGLGPVMLGLGDETKLQIRAGRPGLERLGRESLGPCPRPIPRVEGDLAVAKVAARGEDHVLRDDRRHGHERESRPERAETPPRARALGWEGPEGETEHPDTYDRYPRQLPDPVVCGGSEEGDAARSSRGDLSALQRQRRADCTNSRDENRTADEQQPDDSQLG